MSPSDVRQDPLLEEMKRAYQAPHAALGADIGIIVAAGRRRARRRRFLIGGIIAIAALAITGSAIGVVTAFNGDTSPAAVSHPGSRTSHHRDVPPPLGHDGPRLGTELSLPATMPRSASRLLSQLDVAAPVLIPSSALASTRNLTDVWDCSGQGYVAEFGSGIRVSVMSGWEGVSNDAHWQQFIKSNGYGELGRALGQTAFLAAPTSEDNGSVQVIDHGWMVIVTGNGQISLDDLVAATDSL